MDLTSTHRNSRGFGPMMKLDGLKCITCSEAARRISVPRALPASYLWASQTTTTTMAEFFKSSLPPASPAGSRFLRGRSRLSCLNMSS